MSGDLRRGCWQSDPPGRCPQQSTAFVGPSQNSRNLPEIVGVPYFKSANERVSCNCQLVISRTVSPSVFPSEPRMWSREAAGNTANCAYSRAMWSCRAGQRINLVDDFCGNFAGPASPSGAPPPRGGPQWNSPQGKKRRQPGKENYGPSRNDSPALPLTVRCRAKPPSPSPSITRRRTPVALAAGVHLFLVPLRSQRAAPYSRPTTRLSRWIIAARPEKPRIASMSADERPLIFCASSAS